MLFSALMQPRRSQLVNSEDTLILAGWFGATVYSVVLEQAHIISCEHSVCSGYVVFHKPSVPAMVLF